MRESGDRTAVVTDGDIWIRHDGSPRADGKNRWLFVGDLRGLQDWISRGCPDKPSFRPPAYPWARVVCDPTYYAGYGGRRKAEPLDDDLLAQLAPVFDYL
jgi:hypothetical protein